MTTFTKGIDSISFKTPSTLFNEALDLGVDLFFAKDGSPRTVLRKVRSRFRFSSFVTDLTGIIDFFDSHSGDEIVFTESMDGVSQNWDVRITTPITVVHRNNDLWEVSFSFVGTKQ